MVVFLFVFAFAFASVDLLLLLFRPLLGIFTSIGDGLDSCWR